MAAAFFSRRLTAHHASRRTHLLEHIQRRVDLRQQPFDFRPLVRAGIFVEPFHKPLLSRK